MRDGDEHDDGAALRSELGLESRDARTWALRLSSSPTSNTIGCFTSAAALRNVLAILIERILQARAIADSGRKLRRIAATAFGSYVCACTICSTDLP